MKYDSNHALLETEMPNLPAPMRGKVRDVYDLGDSLLFVATDRISAFDCIMPNGVPDNGKVLTQLSLFWFKPFSQPMWQNTPKASSNTARIWTGAPCWSRN